MVKRRILTSVKEEVASNSQVEFTNIDRDHDVMVILEPNLYQIQTVVEGEGSVTPGATVFWGDNYTVSYAPADGVGTQTDLYRRRRSGRFVV